MEDVPVSGMYLEIDGSQVKIVGAVDFDGVYTISFRRDDGIGFLNDKNQEVGGFLNRYGGSLNLTDYDKDRKKMHKVIDAICRKGDALF